MNRKLQTNAEQYVKKTRGRRRWQWFVRFVASIVVFCTTYALILPAITMEQKAYCGLEEHVHDDSCYIQILDSQETTEAPHVHTAACLDASGAEVCGFHVHSDSCYTKERGDMLCQQTEQEGHAHTEQCYGDEPVMICQQEETDGHSHGEGCYTEQPVLSCQMDVAEAHTHGEGCWEYPLICGQTATEKHTHNDDCYQWSTTLTCDLPQAPAETTPPQPELTCQDPTHDHAARCYGTWELCCGMEEHTHDLRCFSDPDADVETREIWERTFADVELTGVWAEDVLAIARSQLGYQESTRNYDVWEDGTTHGYTRYGHWYGSPYGDWCAMFVSFCIAYAGVDEEAMPLNWGCRTWIADLSQPELDLYRPAADYTPKPGDLIFFDWEDAEGNSDDLSDHVGIVAELIPETEETPARIKTIEGNSSNQVKYNTYDQADTQILGYGVIPENPANLEETEQPEETGPAFTYSDEELYVEVRLPADTTVPADAVLWVTPIDEESADYAAYLARSEEAVEGTVAGIALYDISFYTPDGEYLPVSDRAEVIMGFTKSPVDGEGELQVLHFAQEDTPPLVIDQVTLGEQELEMRPNVQDQPALMALDLPGEPTEETQPATETEPAEETITEVRTVLQFQTDGFSTFAVVQVDFTQEYGTWIVNPDVNALGGQTFLISTTTSILNNQTQESSHRALTSEIVSFEPDGDNQVNNMHLAAASVSNDGTIVTAKTSALETYLWEFQQVKENTYYIKSKANGEYLYIGDGPNAHTSVDPIVITVTKTDNYYVLSDGNGRKLAYEDDAANNGETVFTAFNEPGDRGQFVLSTQLIATKALDVNAELDGVTAVISIRDDWDNEYYAVSSEATGDIGEFKEPRKAVQVTHNSTNDTVYIAPDDVDTLLWTFHKVAGTADTYTIQQEDQFLVQNGTSLGIGETATQFQRVVGEGNGELVLKTTNDRYLSFATDGGFVTFGNPNDDDHDGYQRADLLISQYGPTITETPDGNVVPVTDLDNRFYMIVAVDNDASGKPVALTNGTAKGNADSSLTQTIDGTDYNVLDGQYVANFNFEQGQNFQNYYNLTWFFEPDPASPGCYFIRAYDGQKWNGYLTAEIRDNPDVTDLTIGNENEEQSFQVLQATNTGTASAVVLRWGDSQVYVNLYGNASYNEEDGIGERERNNFFVGYRAGDNAASGQNEPGNHVVLAGFQNVNTVLNAAEYLLDSLDVQDGKYQFSDDAYIGSALPGNANDPSNSGPQGEYGKSHAPDFVAGYDAAQAYRREMQQLARQLREAVAERPFTYDGKTVTLTAMEIAYVKAAIGEIARQHGIAYAAYENVLGDDGQLKWLWDVVGVVQPNNPTGVKVNLFNYDGSVNNTGLAYKENGSNDPKGFTFYHKVQYDEYTQVDTGRDTARNGGVLGSDDSWLEMSPTLGDDGYPVVTDGAGNEFNNANGGSLAYLFSPTTGYHKATMDNGGGLFQRDSEGYYYYNANENAAWYNPDTNQFVLYDTVIRPMYIHGAQPNSKNDVYNFLPFNNPYDDLIFDKPGTIKANTDLATNHTANTERSGYLNERADMWFGMTIEFSFLMANNGMVDILDANGQPTGETVDMVFDFYGDDDVWVYIDNQLVLDLGGVKGAEKGSINFHTGAVYYQDGGRGTTTTTLAKIFGEVKGAQLTGNTFTDGVAHTLKFFYMERGGNVSYCGLRFNMPLLPENFLMVTKSRENEGTDGTKPIGNPYHTFRVVEANAEGNPVKANSQETANLDEMVPYFQENTVFDICHANTTTPVVDTGIVDGDGYFTIPVGYSAVFNDVLTLRRDNTKVHYAIVEVLYDAEDEQYKALNYTLNTVQSRETQFSPNFSAEGVNLYERPVGSFAYTAGINANQSNTLNLSNVVQGPLGKLSVKKILAVGVDVEHNDEEFTVKVEFGGYAIVEKDGAVTSELVYTPAPKGTAYTLTYTGEGGEEKTESKTIDNDDGTIKLKPGQTATFDGIVAGTNYRITEVLGPGDNWIPTYSGTVTGQDSTDGSSHGEIRFNQSASVTITNQDFSVFVGLPLRKKVEYAAMTDTFTFNVQWIQDAYTLAAANKAEHGYYNLPGTSITVTPEKATAGEAGTVIIGFSDDAIKDIKGDTGMAYYKISEQPGNGGYVYDETYYIVGVQITKDPASATITGIWKNGTDKVYPTETGETVPELEFINHRTTSITVEKEVTTGSTLDTFQYTYKVKYPGDTVHTTGSFQLKHNGKHTISGIPIGAIVEVTEENQNDYAASYNVTAVYEAEYGTISGEAKVAYDKNASAGAYVGYIKGDTDTVTIPVYTNAQIGAAFIFRYAQADTRSFTVGGTDYSMPSTGGWQIWQENTEAQPGPTLKAEENELTIGGNVGADAPNLDSLKVIFGRISGNTAAVNVLGDGSVIHFVNEPRTSVTVTKKVEGSDKMEQFTFKYTLTDPKTGVETTGEFTLKDGDSSTITGIPLGALLELKETNPGTANATRMQMTTRLEAEDGEIQGGVSINAAEAASGGHWAGDIHGNNSLTFRNLRVQGPDTPDLNLRYVQDDTRSFVVSINSTDQTVAGGDCDTWADWNLGKTAVISSALPAGTSTLTIRGPDGAFAPNLDYVDLVWPEKTTTFGATPGNQPTLTQYINGETTIVVVNQTGYQLPMTGGTGTQLYTIGGLLLMAAAILLYYQIRRRKGDYASP